MNASWSGRSVIAAMILAACPAGTAWAADLGPDGLVALVPPGPVTGGSARTELFVVVLEPDGSPAVGAKLKAARTVGMDRAWTEVGGGVYKIGFLPPPVVAPSAIDVTVRGKSRTTKTKFTLDRPIELVPAAPAVTAEANLPAMLLGRDLETTITVSGTSEAGTLSRASVGRIADLDVLPGGGASIRYEPPKVQFPQVGVVTFADAARPFDRKGHLVVSLVGTAAYPVKAAPGSAVSLRVGDKVYGPVVADASGVAKVPVEVPPGVTTATQITVVNGQPAEAPLDLQIPETRRLALFPLPLDLPADPTATVPLRVVVVDAAGAPDPNAALAFEVPGGSVGPVTHLGEGVYEAVWTLPEAPGSSSGGTPGAGTVRVRMGSDLQSDAIDVTVVHPRPATVVVTPQVAQIAADTAEVPVVVTLADAAGRPIAGASLDVRPTQATVGEVTDRGNGEYAFVLDPADEGDVSVRVVVTSGASRAPVASVVVVPRATQVATDGGPTEVVVATLDAVGLPVPNVPVKLSAEGGAFTPPEVVTGADGTAVVQFQANAEAGVPRLVGAAGGATGAGLVMAAPTGVAAIALPAAAVARGLPGGVAPAGLLGVGLPLGLSRAQAPGSADAAGSPWGSGDGAPAGGADAAASSDPATDATDPGAAPPAEPAPAEPAPALATLTITAEPASVAPGATLNVTVAAATPAAPGAAPAPPEVAVTGGAVESMTTGDDGKVTAMVKVAPEATGFVEIVAKLGDETRTLSVPIEAPVDPWASPSPGVVPGTAVAAAPVPVTPDPPTPPEVEEAPTRFRWLQARVAGLGSLYRYEQAPSNAPGPLLPERLAVGGPDGGTPAKPLGGELAVRVWGDPVDVPYVGFSGTVRLGSYSIASAAFSQPARDVLTNVDLSVVGRVPVELNGDRYWAGAKAGFLYGDFMLFTGCLEPNCTVNFLPVPVPGLGLGAEIGADVGRLSVIGGYTHGLARGTQPYASLVDLDGAFEVVEHFTVNLGFSVVSRTVTLEGEESNLARGALTDAQMAARLGLGFAL